MYEDRPENEDADHPHMPITLIRQVFIANNFFKFYQIVTVRKCNLFIQVIQFISKSLSEYGVRLQL